MINALKNIPSTEGVRKVEPAEGERFDVAGAHLMWKVKAKDSGYAFSVCEQTLSAGESIPLHSHPSPEAFYIIAGQTDFLRILDGKEDWIRCEAGSIVILPPNSLHAIYNRSSDACRMLDISTPMHQAFFDAVAGADHEEPFSALPFPQAMARVAQIGLANNMYFSLYNEPPPGDVSSGALHDAVV